MILHIQVNDILIAAGIAFISTTLIFLLTPKYLSTIKEVAVITLVRFLLILSIMKMHIATQDDLYIIKLSLLFSIIALSSLDILTLRTYTVASNKGQSKVNTGSTEKTKSIIPIQTHEKDTSKTSDEAKDLEEIFTLLRNISVDEVEWLVDFGNEKQSLGMKVAMAHILQRVGKEVPNHQTWEDIKREHNEGVSKEYIGTCKRILKANGLMKSIPFGTKEKIVWEDDEVIALTIIAKQIEEIDDV